MRTSVTLPTTVWRFAGVFSLMLGLLSLRESISTRSTAIASCESHLRGQQFKLSEPWSFWQGKCHFVNKHRSIEHENHRSWDGHRNAKEIGPSIILIGKLLQGVLNLPRAPYRFDEQR